VAILYIVSDQPDAFSKGDQRVLRVMGRIIEELIRTYSARQEVTEELGNLITHPSIVDMLFKDFLSENEFIQDIETLLTGIKTRMDQKETQVQSYEAPYLHPDVLLRQEEPPEEVVSFISIDIDNQSGLASKYGDGMIRNLSRTIGLQVQEMIKALITKHTDCKLYHIYAARFYVLLKGISLEQARIKAETIRQALQGPISVEQPNPPVRPLVLSDVTIRLGVSSYTYRKLEENLVSDHPENIVAEVRVKVTRALDVALNMGKDEGGNVVIAWNPQIGGFARWSPSPKE
jgi:GGDEF domain-containing protein